MDDGDGGSPGKLNMVLSVFAVSHCRGNNT